MSGHQALYSTAITCRVLGLSRSGYYAWRSRPASARARADTELLSEILELASDAHQRSLFGRAPVQPVEFGHQVQELAAAEVIVETPVDVAGVGGAGHDLFPVAAELAGGDVADLPTTPARTSSSIFACSGWKRFCMPQWNTPAESLPDRLK